MNDDGQIVAMRYQRLEGVYLENRGQAFEVWREPFVQLRLPLLFNLRRDPFEKSQHNSNTYHDWFLDRAFVLVPMQVWQRQFRRSARSTHSRAWRRAKLFARVLDNSISTELGGARQEITALFTDVRGFTSIAESVEPDALMQQTSRYFTGMTDVILAQGGTVDKFIGDAVMAFWNAPNRQDDHCERACRAALQAKAVNQAINRQFEAEGLQPFHTRLEFTSARPWSAISARPNG